MVAAWRRGRAVDNVVVPVFMALSALPAFFTALLGRLLPRAEAALVPDPARL
jgi:ABC-type dipeptide/oligopeptide/nickel transport system permease component